jgi:hypothetical protein
MSAIPDCLEPLVLEPVHSGIGRWIAAKNEPYTEYARSLGNIPAGRARIFIYTKGGYDPGPYLAMRQMVGAARLSEVVGLSSTLAINGEVFLTAGETYFSVDVPVGECKVRYENVVQRKGTRYKGHRGDREIAVNSAEGDVLFLRMIIPPEAKAHDGGMVVDGVAVSFVDRDIATQELEGLALFRHFKTKWRTDK